MLVVFQETLPTDRSGTASINCPELKTVQELSGSWQLAFDSERGVPASIQFDALTDWASHSNSGIQNYSGEAVYHMNFYFPEHSRVSL
jgi:hypothetical protein